jgi:hypothetical protein
VLYRSSDDCISLELVLCCDVLLVREKNNNNWIDLMSSVDLSNGFCCDLLFKCVGLVLLTESFSLLVHGSNSALLTYLFIPWSRVLLQKLTGLQLVKKVPAFCGTRKFITAFTSARHLSLP